MLHGTFLPQWQTLKWAVFISVETRARASSSWWGVMVQTAAVFSLSPEWREVLKTHPTPERICSWWITTTSFSYSSSLRLFLPLLLRREAEILIPLANCPPCAALERLMSVSCLQRLSLLAALYFANFNTFPILHILILIHVSYSDEH